MIKFKSESLLNLIELKLNCNDLIVDQIGKCDILGHFVGTVAR